MVVRNITALSILEGYFIYTSEDRWAGALVSGECLLGLLMLLSVIIGCYRIPILKKSPFGTLMANQNLAQLIACTNSGVFFFLGVLLDIKSIIKHSNIFGNLSIFLIPTILGSFLLMSVNRFCASMFPFYYSLLFSRRFVKIYIIANWLLPIIPTVVLMVFLDCNFVFYHFGWLFTGAPMDQNQKCGTSLVYYAMYIQLTLSVMIFIIDVITLLRLTFARSTIYQHHTAENRRREITFASQVLIQGAIFIMHGFWYDLGYGWIPGYSEKWKIFFTTSFSSNLLHVIDPLIVFIFNIEFRKRIICKKPSNKSTIVSAIGLPS